MRFPRFNNRDARERTFITWRRFINPKDLVESGLFYLGGGDMVQCYYCGVILHSWKPTDTVDMEHLRHSPCCSFIRNRMSNIAINAKDVMYMVLENMYALTSKFHDLENKVNIARFFKNDAQDDVDIALDLKNHSFKSSDEVLEFGRNTDVMRDVNSGLFKKHDVRGFTKMAQSISTDGQDDDDDDYVTAPS